MDAVEERPTISCELPLSERRRFLRQVRKGEDGLVGTILEMYSNDPEKSKAVTVSNVVPGFVFAEDAGRGYELHVLCEALSRYPGRPIRL